MSADKETPWMAAWRAWVELAGTGFKAGGGRGFEQRDTSASGFADVYQNFARVIQQMMREGGSAGFARHFIESLRAAAGCGNAPLQDDAFLNVFVRTAPRALLGVFPDAGAGQAWQQGATTLVNWAQEWLALPGVGPQREWQAMLQAVQRALLGELEARAVVDEHYRLANRAALERFAATLEDDAGPPIKTLRALYDAWVDEAEAAYSERVMSETFSRDFAAWVNAGSDVRLALRRLGGRLSALFDAPARDEIDALLARQQAMQRELTALRAERNAQRTATVKGVVQTQTGQNERAQANAPAETPRSRAPHAARPRAVKVPADKAPKPARSAAPAVRKRKAARGEFDIGNILDAGQ